LQFFLILKGDLTIENYTVLVPMAAILPEIKMSGLWQMAAVLYDRGRRKSLALEQ
jgi:hypothetical protein